MKEFLVMTKKLVECKSVQLLVLYRYDSSKSKNISIVQYVFAVKKRCPRGRVAGDDIISA